MLRFTNYPKRMFMPDTGANNGAGQQAQSNADTDNGANTSNYEELKALYDKLVADSAKAKKSYDATAHELAELKKVQRAKMSDEEKAAEEKAEQDRKYKELFEKYTISETSRIFAKEGYNEDDYKDLTQKIVAVSGENSTELATTIIDFAKKISQAAVASAINGTIKDGVLPPKSGDNGDFSNGLIADIVSASTNVSKAQDIKNKYR